MLKTAIYGMVRVIYDLIGGIRWEWGIVVLLIGVIVLVGALQVRDGTETVGCKFCRADHTNTVDKTD